MRREDLLEMIRTKPFVPFRIFVSDGTTYEVRHPEQILVEHSKATILVRESSSIRRFEDTEEKVALLHITRLRPLPRSVLGNGN